MLWFVCFQFVVDCVDFFVNFGVCYIFYFYQIVGGNFFNLIMELVEYDLVKRLICIFCLFFQDLFNYWMVVMFFKYKNGLYYCVF